MKTSPRSLCSRRRSSPSSQRGKMNKALVHEEYMSEDEEDGDDDQVGTATVGVKTGRPRGRGSRAVDLGSMGNKGRRTQCLPRFGPSQRANTLRPA
jgi:hypothetical protein